jgi:hypothetical protein
VNNLKLGSFEVTGGAIRCTDPCYEAGIWCATEVMAMNGIWHAGAIVDDIPGWGERVVKLYAECPDGVADSGHVTDHLAVDSGQFGFFDSIRYPLSATGEYDDPHSFYGRCCQVTLENMAGVIDYGVVSSSGFGDGSYAVSCDLDSLGRAVRLEVTFLGEEDVSGVDVDG